jgi:hypothetical protein
MTKIQAKELASMTRRVNLLPITSAQRVEATAALRKSFLVVEGLTWLVHHVRQIWAFSSNRAWRVEQHRHG